MGTMRHVRAFIKCAILSKVRSKPNLTFCASLRSSATAPQKLYISSENEYAHRILPELSRIHLEWHPRDKIGTLADFDTLLDQNWRSSNASAIVEAFERAKEVTVSHDISISDKRFDKLVDGLMDHCEKLTDEELLRLLSVLVDYPPCESSDSRNFHDVWSCLDDICCWKMGAWNLETMYTVADVWYKWNLGRLSDYVCEVLDKATVKSKHLSKNMLLYTFFFLNVSRKTAVPFEFKHVLARRIGEFSVDELGVIAMGYFKTKSKVKLKPILSAMIKAISENCNTINEITLAALLKVIRLSQNTETVDEIPPMLDKLITEIPRLSNMCLVHVALIGTSLQLKHTPTLTKSTEKLLKDIENVRVKDIERTLLACSMFDIDTSPSFFEKAFTELHKESRREEFIRYNRCLPSALHFLSFRKLYSPEYMNTLLDEEYINETFGKHSKQLPRELFSLDACIDIECPDYTGNRLPPHKKYKAAKWLTEFTPTHDQPKRLSASDKYYLDVAEHVRAVVGAERFMRCDHVLPHFSKSDIVVCKDRSSGEFVEPFGFENYVLGDVKRPFEVDKYKWFAVVVLTPNLTVRNASLPLGLMIMKGRQLEAVGYTPVFVFWNRFATLSTPEKTALVSQQLV